MAISATRHPIDFVFGSKVGFSGTEDRTAPFPVGSNPRWPYLSNALCDSLYVYVHRPYFDLGLCSIMTEIRYLHVFHKGGSLADLRCKEKERKGRS